MPTVAEAGFKGYGLDGWWGLFAPRMLNQHEAVEFILDITQRKQAEKEREQLDEALNRRAAELEAILAQLEREHVEAHLAFELVGPWPPYSFATSVDLTGARECQE